MDSTAGRAIQVVRANEQRFIDAMSATWAPQRTPIVVHGYGFFCYAVTARTKAHETVDEAEA